MKPPLMDGYKPFGIPRELETVVLQFEELEAIRLADYEHLYQEEAAKNGSFQAHVHALTG